MRKRTDRAKHAEARLITPAEVAEYLSLGLNRAVEFAVQAGARRQIGKRVLYDRKAIDAYIDAMAPDCDSLEISK